MCLKECAYDVDTSEKGFDEASPIDKTCLKEYAYDFEASVSERLGKTSPIDKTCLEEHAYDVDATIFVTKRVQKQMHTKLVFHEEESPRYRLNILLEICD